MRHILYESETMFGKLLKLRVIAGGHVDLTLCAVVMTLWALVTLLRMQGAPALDLTALYMAGKLWNEGAVDLIYAVPPGYFGAAPPEWQNSIATYGLAEMSVTPFIYPPLWLPVLGELANGVSIQSYFAGGRFVLVPIMAACVPVAWRILRPDISMVTMAALAVVFLEVSHISRFGLALGQPQISVTFLILSAFLAYTTGRGAISGALLALAVAAKLSPLIFVLVFIVDRAWRPLCAFCITGALLFLVSLKIGGVALHMDYLRALQELNSATLLSVHNPSVKALLATLQYPGQGGVNNATLTPLSALVVWSVRAMGVAAIALWARAVLHMSKEQRLGPALFALSLIAAAFGPLGWMHYYILPAFLFPSLMQVFSKGRAGAIALLTLVFTSTILVAGIVADIAYGPLTYNLLFVTGALALAFVALSPARQQYALASPHSREKSGE